jgi:hypothetical protein
VLTSPLGFDSLPYEALPTSIGIPLGRCALAAHAVLLTGKARAEKTRQRPDWSLCAAAVPLFSDAVADSVVST